MSGQGENGFSCIILMKQNAVLDPNWCPKARIWFWIWQTPASMQTMSNESLVEASHIFGFVSLIWMGGKVVLWKICWHKPRDAYLNQIIWKITKKLNASKINSTKTNLLGNKITSYRWIGNVKLYFYFLNEYPQNASIFYNFHASLMNFIFILWSRLGNYEKTSVGQNKHLTMFIWCCFKYFIFQIFLSCYYP